MTRSRIVHVPKAGGRVSEDSWVVRCGGRAYANPDTRARLPAAFAGQARGEYDRSRRRRVDNKAGHDPEHGQPARQVTPYDIEPQRPSFPSPTEMHPSDRMRIVRGRYRKEDSDRAFGVLTGETGVAQFYTVGVWCGAQDRTVIVFSDGFRPLLRDREVCKADTIEGMVRELAEYYWPVSVKGVLIHDAQTMLLKNERDEWELPGGKLDLGEDPGDCVVREIREELALEAHVSRLLDTWVYKICEDRVVLIVTFGMLTNTFDGFQYSNEHKEARVFPVHEVPKLTMPSGYKASIATYWETMRRLQSVT